MMNMDLEVKTIFGVKIYQMVLVVLIIGNVLVGIVMKIIIHVGLKQGLDNSVHQEKIPNVQVEPVNARVGARVHVIVYLTHKVPLKYKE